MRTAKANLRNLQLYIFSNQRRHLWKQNEKYKNIGWVAKANLRNLQLYNIFTSKRYPWKQNEKI